MMVPVEDEEDDFIVQTVAEPSSPEAQRDSSTRGRKWGRYLGGLVFSSKEPAPAAAEPEPEPTLPVGFSATLNAEEEKIYPAQAKIKVLVAEGSLAGRNRRQAAELHQALQQVVGAAAIYNHLLVRHGGVGTRPKGDIYGSPDGDKGEEDTPGDGDEPDAPDAKITPCVCGGAVGSCKAISSLLKEEMDKVVAAAETERRGAMLKKFKLVERRSGGLCNPDLLHKVVRSSSTGPTDTSPRLSASAAAAEAGRSAAALLPPRSEPGAALLSPTAVATSNLVVEDGGSGGLGTPVGGAAAAAAQDVPWAEDMLCRAIRKRHAAMLKTRGRALAKGLARMLKGVSSELKGVASRLPPWEEDEDDEDKPAPQEEKAALDRILSLGNVYGSPTHSRTLSQSSYASADTAEDVPDRISLNSSPVTDTADTANGSSSSSSSASPSISGRPPTPSSSAVSAVAAAASAVKTAVVAPVRAVTSAVAPGKGGGGATSSSTTGSAEDIRGRRQDWKLDAQELSLIRKEEERVMKPDVLARLLAKGATLGCLQQADFWDVFARLEVATRTEALLNIAIRGGRGCAARSGRMGRELCMSLTSVVLEAINIVEQAQLRSQVHTTPVQPSPRQQQRQRKNSSDSANPEDETRHQRQQLQNNQEEQTSAAERPRPSSERLSRGSLAAVAAAARNGEGAARARAGSVGLPARRVVRGEKVSGTAGVARTFFKEDPGLKDLDRREEEFRKAIYVNRRALATRLLRYTNDKQLCSQVLGTFVDDRARNATNVEETQARPRSMDRVAPVARVPAQAPRSLFASSPGGLTMEGAAAAAWKPSIDGNSCDEDPSDTRRTSDPGDAAADVNLLTQDGSGRNCEHEGDHTIATSAATTSAISNTTGGSDDCAESKGSLAVSVSSENTDPLSEGTEDSDNGPTSASSRSSTWGERQQEQQQQGPVADKRTVAGIYQVSANTSEAESFLV
ncbi:unnamed protein product [Scytosiphon promiscuus]